MHEEARVLWTKASIAMIVQILKELMRIWNGLDSHSITEKRSYRDCSAHAQDFSTLRHEDRNRYMLPLRPDEAKCLKQASCALP